MRSESELTLDQTMHALVLISLRNLSMGDQIDVLTKAKWTNAQFVEATGMKLEAIKKRKTRSKEKTNGS